MILVLALIVAVVAGLGFYMGWFHFSSGSDDRKCARHCVGGQGPNPKGQGQSGGQGRNDDPESSGIGRPARDGNMSWDVGTPVVFRSTPCRKCPAAPDMLWG